MAFAVRDLSVLAYAQGFTFWHYKAGADEMGTIAARGFFNSANDLLSVGDMLAVSSVTGGRVLCVVEAAPVVAMASLS